MKKLCLFVYLSFFFSSFSYAHGDHSHAEADELLKVYQSLTTLFRLHLQNTSTLQSQALSAPNIRLGYSHQSVSFNQSAMNEIMQLAIEGYELSQEHHCHGCYQSTPWYKKAMSFIANLPVSLPSTLYRTFEHPIENTKKLAKVTEAFVRRNMRSYDPTLFVVIVITQAAWETVETAISVAIGAPGFHIACTIFNAALLGATLPIERFIKLASHHGAGLNLIERLRLAQKSMAWQLRFALFGGGTELTYGDANIVLRSANLETDDHNLMEVTLKEGGFFASILNATPMESQAKDEVLSATRSLRDDLNRIFDPQLSTDERMYIAHMHAKGFQVLVNLLVQLEASLRETELPRQTYLPITELAGRMRHILTDYSAQIMLLASSPLQQEQAQLKERYRHFMEHFVTAFHDIGDAIEAAHLQSESSQPTVVREDLLASLASLESKAKNLSARLKVLRGANQKSCHMTFQTGEWAF